ncbi:MAG: hypothetical protein M1434_11105 [Chloroflexi bacterium]|nr:hypothetical protein [Chloroflexota bacterium]MCL5275272.1 hypothetical protein [Chloroflexota bacterium]
MNRRRNSFVLIVGLILLISAVIYFAAKHSPVACDQILDTQLRAVPFDSITSDTMGQWIKKSYGLADAGLSVDESVYPDSSGRKPKLYAWKSGDKRYNGFVSSNVTYITVNLSNQPTVDEVLACFGEPSSYQATNMIYPDRTFIFNLWYPEQGVVLGHSVIPGLGNVLDHLLGHVGIVDGNTLIGSIEVVKPDSLENMIGQLYDKANWDKVTRSLKPWPGSIDKVRVDMKN